MSAARLELLTELGRALGAEDTSAIATATKRALPAHLYYDGPFERRSPRAVVSLEPPTRLDREAWELARRGDRQVHQGESPRAESPTGAGARSSTTACGIQ